MQQGTSCYLVKLMPIVYLKPVNYSSARTLAQQRLHCRDEAESRVQTSAVKHVTSLR
jgi:hypothetical protein